MAATGKDEETVSFDQVLSEELEEIAAARTARAGRRAGRKANSPSGGNVEGRAQAMNLVGLAFSGGGIRSATFNLGVLQGFAKFKLLPLFDYLSTVSGGGYIGSWFTTWVARSKSLAAVQEDLARREEPGAKYHEPEPITFLRRYSNYLTPKLGMFSADTWALASTYLRNLILNLLIVFSFFLAVFLAPRLVVWRVSVITGSPGSPELLFSQALAVLTFAVFMISVNQVYWSIAPGAGRNEAPYPWYARQFSIILLIVLPLCSSAVMGGVWLWYAAAHGVDSWGPYATAMIRSLVLSWLAGLLVAGLHRNAAVAKAGTRLGKFAEAAMSTAAQYGAALVESVKLSPRHPSVVFLIVLIPSLLAGVGLLAWLEMLFSRWLDADSGLWYAVAFAGPLVAAVFVLVGTLQVGLMGRRMPDESREWWGRLGGLLLAAMAGWTVLCGIGFFSLPLVAKATGLVSAGWIASTAAGVILGKSPATGGAKSNKGIERAAKLLPYAFVLGLLMLMSLLTTRLMTATADWDALGRWIKHSGLASAGPVTSDAAGGWGLVWRDIWTAELSLSSLATTNFFIMNQTLDVRLAVLIVLCLAAAFVLSWRIDINQFSIHNLYRNRLLRGYLGASNRQRRAHPFTGFDPNDDLPLVGLRVDRGNPAGGYHGPYHLLNAAINMVRGKELAWQARKAAAFLFAPLSSGYTVRTEQGRRIEKEWRYRDTALYGKRFPLTVGTALAVSGAAASPNMGYHTAPALAFLMTIFNVRLGWWSGNPRNARAWRSDGPLVGLACLLRELFGLADADSRYVYLSDGGHFENLGIYELVRRRCRVIVACDAGQDQGMKFDDLGNAVRKVRTDLGVDIRIDIAPIRDQQRHWAVGDIVYRSEAGREETGTLVYIKASPCGRMPTDAWNYRERHEVFPHQTTADQWFDEAQFESYRALGSHVVEEMLGERFAAKDIMDVVKKAKTVGVRASAKDAKTVPQRRVKPRT